MGSNALSNLRLSRLGCVSIEQGGWGKAAERFYGPFVALQFSNQAPGRSSDTAEGD